MQKFMFLAVIVALFIANGTSDELNWDAYNVRVYVHRISNSNGANGVSNNMVNLYMDHLKTIYKQYNIYIQWLNPEAIDEIPDDKFAVDRPIFDDLWQKNPHEDAIDIYFGTGETLSYFNTLNGFSGSVPSLHLWLHGSAHENVLIHEFGHCLGLYHTYEPGDDGCLDTTYPDNWNQLKYYLINECGKYQAGEPSLVEDVPENIYRNYMSASPKECKDLFTGCQITKMKNTLENVTLLNQAASESKKVSVDNKTIDTNSDLGGSLSVDDLATHSSSYDFVNIPSGSFKYMSVADSFIAKTNNATLGTKKHLRWWDKSDQYLLKTDPFPFPPNNTIRANYTVQNSIKIKYLLQNVAQYIGGSFTLHDPWYVDANSNQPDGYKSYTFSEPGFDYNVFLNQNSTFDPTKPYYSVKASASQTATAHGETVSYAFDRWGGTGVQYQSPDNRETPVVFNSAGAVAEARWQGNH